MRLQRAIVGRQTHHEAEEGRRIPLSGARQIHVLMLLSRHILIPHAGLHIQNLLDHRKPGLGGWVISDGLPTHGTSWPG